MQDQFHQSVFQSPAVWLNNLGAEEKISYTKILAHQVFNAMILVLIISMIIALAIQDWISGGVIGGVIGINVVVGFLQEFKAEKTMGSLRNLSSPTARVGDTIPADLRLFDSMNLETDEALLTGESLPVAKDHEMVYKDFSTPVPGSGIVYATGLNTEIGAIAQSLKGNNGLIRRVDKSDGRKPKKREYSKAAAGTVYDVIGNILGVNVGTPLQKRLSWLAILLFWVAVVFAIVVMASQKFHVNKEVAIYASVLPFP
ncbi:Sodium transport ATPase 1 [Candida viswanathii]|uniref:Sodium transport ATPase 1 n=1 Tax=Candida viswanathii TaxID=5486 RepID=A0A367YJD5_9ASCO|nr:Sodium transport ATPase 1 [Candida viswanathii]